MKKKYFLTALLILSLALSLISCVEECVHVDVDDDYLCDNCGEHYDDGDETPESTAISVTFSVKYEEGDGVPGVQFTLTKGGQSYSFVSGADGSVKGELEAGLYSVDVNYDTLPEYCTTDIFGVKIEEDTDSVSITVINNTPDGSAKKPFFLSESETEITLAAGQEIYYRIHMSSVRYVTVDSAELVISYNGETSQQVDGIPTLVITSDSMDVADCVFSVKNSSAASVTATLGVKAPLGSYENPIEVDDRGATVTVNSDTVVYYKWVATADGVLTLTANSDRNNIYVRRVLENDVPVDSYTGGELSTSMEVAAGDVITIGVSALEAQKDHENHDYDVEISFTLSLQ